jgi:hypothetical protein
MRRSPAHGTRRPCAKGECRSGLLALCVERGTRQLHATEAPVQLHIEPRSLARCRDLSANSGSNHNVGTARTVQLQRPACGDPVTCCSPSWSPRRMAASLRQLSSLHSAGAPS